MAAMQGVSKPEALILPGWSQARSSVHTGPALGTEKLEGREKFEAGSTLSDGSLEEDCAGLPRAVEIGMVSSSHEDLTW